MQREQQWIQNHQCPVRMLYTCATALAQLKMSGLSQSSVNGFASSIEEADFQIQNQAKKKKMSILSGEGLSAALAAKYISL